METNRKSIRKVKKETPASKSFLQPGSTPLVGPSSASFSLWPNARLQKARSSSLEKLSCISENTDDYDNYLLEYSKYLLRTAQNQILINNKSKKEEDIKKCLVSLKLEFEELLETFVQLRSEIYYFKMYINVLHDVKEKIESGNKILNVLKDNDFENLLKNLSKSLDHCVNRLELVDIDKKIIDEAFRKNIWGSGSKIEECLEKIDSYIEKNKDGVSKISEVLVEIKNLLLENTMLKERVYTIFDKISNEVLNTNYKVFTDVVKKAFTDRENNKSESVPMSLDCDLGFLISNVKSMMNTQVEESLQCSKVGSLCPMTPKSTSTPKY